MKRILALLLVLALVFSFIGCNKESNTDAQDAKILSDRRDIVESYMRKMATVLWRATEDITYSNSSKSEDPTVEVIDPTYIRAGRLYRGLPYSHAAGGPNAFLEYAGLPDENGIYEISGLTCHSLNGSNATARIGNDCASAVGLSWGQLGNSLVQDSNTKYMTIKYGYLRVGEYKSNEDAHTYTLPICEANGYDVMAEAYAKLQKADAVVMRNKADNNGHARLIVSVYVDRNEEGIINGATSYVTVIEQTSGTIENELCEYDAQFGENVYKTYLIDKKYTFFDLFSAGYLPVTCKELIDPSPVAPEAVSDSLTAHSEETIFEGTLTSTRFMESISVVICDENGNSLQRCTASPTNRKLYTFDLQTFVTDRPEVLRGRIDLDALSAGNYRCMVICRLITGTEITVRNFNFSK